MDRELYRVIWKKALELGFDFNETDAHEMAIVVREFLTKQKLKLN